VIIETTRVGLRPPAPGIMMTLGLHALMIAVMAWSMLIVPTAAAALLGAMILIVASVPCAPIARRSAAGWRHIVDLWAMAGVLIVTAASASPAVSPFTLPAEMGGMTHGASVSLASPSVVALAIAAGWLACRLALTTLAGRRGERMARLRHGAAAVTAAGLGLMLAFH
jgi:hypothetical protein